MTDLCCDILEVRVTPGNHINAELRLMYSGDLDTLLVALAEARAATAHRPSVMGGVYLRALERNTESVDAGGAAPPIVATIEAGQSGADAPSKPPAQVVSPAGTPPGPVAANSGIAPAVNEELRVLVNNPWFQQYCRENTQSDIDDDLKLAVGVVKMLLLVDGKMWGPDSMNRLHELRGKYQAWCDAKGYK